MPSAPGHVDAHSIFVSGYTEPGSGAGPGLVRFDLLADGSVGDRRGESSNLLNPSFVIAADGCLLAAEELEQGNVVALDPVSLDVVGRAPTRGAHSCHVAIIDGQVWVANYSSGDASVLSLAGLFRSTADAPVPRILQHPGSGPVSDRQGESHAHQVTATAWGTALVADLGADRVDEYALADGDYALLRSAQLPPGTGPRHIAIKGDFLMVAGELDGYLHVLRKTPRDAGVGGHGGEYFWHWLFKAALAESPQMLEKAVLENAGEFYPSHIELSSDGSKLYAAVRGPNTLVVLDVTGLSADPASGKAPTRPSFLREVPCAGDWPRHFALQQANGRNKIYVANQRTNNVAVFDLDENGLPGLEPVQLVEFGSPTCVLIP